MEIDINKKLQDQANEIVKKATERAGVFPQGLQSLLKEIVAMSLRQGFIWGVSSMKQTSELLLRSIKGEKESQH